MSETTLKTRIVQKHDTSEHWDLAVNFIPKDGEIIVYSDLNKIKIGDGITVVKNLPFFTAMNPAVSDEILDFNI